MYSCFEASKQTHTNVLPFPLVIENIMKNKYFVDYTLFRKRTEKRGKARGAFFPGSCCWVPGAGGSAIWAMWHFPYLTLPAEVEQDRSPSHCEDHIAVRGDVPWPSCDFNMGRERCFGGMCSDSPVWMCVCHLSPWELIRLPDSASSL